MTEPVMTIPAKPPRRPVTRGWEVFGSVLLITLSTLGASAMILAMLEGGNPWSSNPWRSVGLDVACLLATSAFFVSTALWVRTRRARTSRWMGWAVFISSALILAALFGDQWRVDQISELNDMVAWVAGLLGVHILVWWTGPSPQSVNEVPAQRHWRGHALLGISLFSLALLVMVLWVD